MIYEMLCGDRPFGELRALEAREAGVKAAPFHGLSRQQNAALAQALTFGREARTGGVETLLAGLAVHTKRQSRSLALLGATFLAVIAAVGLTWFALDRPRVSRQSVVVDGATSSAQQVAVSPNSIAVLPLLDLSTRPARVRTGAAHDEFARRPRARSHPSAGTTGVSQGEPSR